ncbi:hypothetical protein R3P38DRAFT_3433258 [Favolaschia claudopus]|uniref:Uncharacterized protein n=1 Tax=Favolaschia claudopus TaxID=2862362 RepID=A0AAW0CY35_9AGAR
MSLSNDPVSVTARDDRIWAKIDSLLAEICPDLSDLPSLAANELDLVIMNIGVANAGSDADHGRWYNQWEVLKRGPKYAEFLQKLKHGHENKRYQPVIELVDETVLSNPAIQPAIAITLPKVTIEDITRRITEFLSPLQADIKEVVMGNRSLPLWKPTKPKGKYKDFLAGLKIPLDSRGKPDMLLFELGQLCRDPEFKERLDTVFQYALPEHKFVMNTSGSGKTKLLFEGLTKYWGLYLVSTKDTHNHGSKDLQNIIDFTLENAPGYTKRLPSYIESPPETPVSESKKIFIDCLQRNQEIAGIQFGFLLLARLHILRMFLEVIPVNQLAADGPENKFPTRWLQLQIQPSILAVAGIEDIFGKLTSMLVKEFSQRISKTELLQENAIQLRRIQRMKSFRRELPELPMGNARLYVVLDEVQKAAAEHPYAFRSVDQKFILQGRNQVQRDIYGPERPVLRELLLSLVPYDNLTVVAAGTGVNFQIVNDAILSATAKYGTYKTFTDIGSFGSVKSANAKQKQYIRRFIPPKSELQEGDHDKLKALRRRVASWLRGRFRFTAGLISELLADEFVHPHETLDWYYTEMTKPIDDSEEEDRYGTRRFPGFAITDNRKWVNPECMREVALQMSPRRTFAFSKLRDHPDTMRTVIYIARLYWFGSEGVISNVNVSETILVQWGFARFRPGTGAQNLDLAQIDEPLVFLAIAQWLNAGREESIHHSLTLDMSSHDPSTGRNALEHYLAFCFAGLFSAKINNRDLNLDEIFTFTSASAEQIHPEWAKQPARLVSLHRKKGPGGRLDVSPVDWWARPSYSLSAGRSHNAMLKFLRHGTPAPLCFPPENMGPDLLFVLELMHSKKRIWVAVQSKYQNLPTTEIDEYNQGLPLKPCLLHPETMKKAIRSVTPRNFFISQVGVIVDMTIRNSHWCGIQERQQGKKGETPKEKKKIETARKTKETNEQRNLETHKDVLAALSELPDRELEHTGKYSLLRVVASWPDLDGLVKGRRQTSTLIEKTPQFVDPDNHPLAGLDFETLAKVTAHMSPQDYLKVRPSKALAESAKLKRKANEAEEADESDSDEASDEPSKKRRRTLPPGPSSVDSGMQPDTLTNATLPPPSDIDMDFDADADADAETEIRSPETDEIVPERDDRGTARESPAGLQWEVSDEPESDSGSEHD